MARSEAERASRLKDEFIATLSHELRTPLNVMLGWTRMLEERPGHAGSAHAAAIVARNGRLLARLVGDLLDISLMTTGQFRITRSAVQLNDVVQATADAMATLASERNVAMFMDLPAGHPPVAADAERIQQVISNLLSNAIRFTPAGGHVQVRTHQAGDRTVLTVSDNGIGFDESFAAELFTPFRQADPSVRREQGGLGLGLSIAKSIVELHGGTVTGTSAGVGHGATFTVSLPAVNT
jgi:signal transduction histidine kinase